MGGMQSSRAGRHHAPRFLELNNAGGINLTRQAHLVVYAFGPNECVVGQLSAAPHKRQELVVIQAPDSMTPCRLQPVGGLDVPHQLKVPAVYRSILAQHNPQGLDKVDSSTCTASSTSTASSAWSAVRSLACHRGRGIFSRMHRLN